MRVAVFGATGFVGSYILDELVAGGHHPAVLIRPGSEDKLRHAEQCSIVPGDISDTDAVARTLQGCDVAIYLIGILREDPSKGITFDALQYEGAKRAINLAVENSVKHFLLMSANGIDDGGTDYQRSKYAAEQHLQASDIRCTIFRPSVIFGDPRGLTEIGTQLCQQMIDPPIPAPAFFRGLSPSKGSFSMTPVHVADVAKAFVLALETDTCGLYPLGGTETLRWPEMIRRLAAARGRRKFLVPAPAFGVQLACALFDRFQWFPLTGDQFSMLLDGNVVEHSEYFDGNDMQVRGMTVEELSYLNN